MTSELEQEEEEDWERLENVRACCDGKHDGENPILIVAHPRSVY